MPRAAVLLLLCIPAAPAADLPPDGDVDWPSFREQVSALLAAMAKLDAPLPDDTAKAVRLLVAEKSPADPAESARAVQKLLDAQCLVGVHINPESRVKATRGGLAATLTRDKPTYVLIRVHNEAGVTHPLSAACEESVASGGWLDLAVLNDKPFTKRLSGQRVEYRVMKLTARQSGKREATLSYDVGQGTQDLGFRSDVPILFAVRPK